MVAYLPSLVLYFRAHLVSKFVHVAYKDRSLNFLREVKRPAKYQKNCYPRRFPVVLKKASRCLPTPPPLLAYLARFPIPPYPRRACQEEDCNCIS